MAKSGLSYIGDEIKFAFQDVGFWCGNRKDDLMYHVRGVRFALEDAARDVRFNLGMAVPTMQDYVANSPKLNNLADRAQRKAQVAQDTAASLSWKAGNAFKPAISDVKPSDEPAFIVKLRHERGAAEIANAVDAEVIETIPPKVDYKP